MLYHVGFNTVGGTYPSAAEAIDIMAALKNLIIGNTGKFNTAPIIDIQNTTKVFGSYPKKPYVWVCDDLPSDATQGVRSWFKKEHPLYEGHFLYVGLCLIRNSVTNYYSFSVDIAEEVTPAGVITNLITNYNPTVVSSGGDVYWTLGGGQYNYGGNCYYYPVVNKVTKKGYTFLIGDWGFGVFGSSASTPKIPSFGNFNGAVYLETLAVDLNLDNPKAFIPKNYPMILNVSSEGLIRVNYSGWAVDAQPRRFNMIRCPEFNGAAPSHVELGDYITSLASSITGNNSANKDILGVDAEGNAKAQVFPTYLMLQNSLLAKLPVVKPVIGSDRYTHVGKTIEIDSIPYYGIFAINKPTGATGSVLSDGTFINLRRIAANQEYLRMG